MCMHTHTSGFWKALSFPCEMKLFHFLIKNNEVSGLQYQGTLHLFFVLFCVCFSVGIELRASCMLSKHSLRKEFPQPLFFWARVLLCGPGWLQTCNLHASVFWMLELHTHHHGFALELLTHTIFFNMALVFIYPFFASVILLSLIFFSFINLCFYSIAFLPTSHALFFGQANQHNDFKCHFDVMIPKPSFLVLSCPVLSFRTF
jgi:hypothetical protein